MHFALLIIHDKEQDLDLMMSPYNENIEGRPHRVYTEEEIRERAIKLREDNPNIPCLQVSDDEIISGYKEFHNLYFHNSFDYFVENELWSTYNQNSKWDYYDLDAFDYWCVDKQGIPLNVEPDENGNYKVSDIPDDWWCNCVMIPSGDWYEAGMVGWFDVDVTEEEERIWKEKFHERFLEPYKDYYCHIADCHI